MKNIAIFASGEGTNAQNIIDYFRSNPSVNVSLIVCNNKSANVLNRAQKEGIDSIVINREALYDKDDVIWLLKSKNVDLIVLAGFLWLIPKSLITSFPNKIVNIHPALLPKYGGKGMYGTHVHTAVVAAKEKESGITIHYVNEEYDSGAIVAQHKCSISPLDNAKDVSKKIHDLEAAYFPKTIEKILMEEE